MTEKHIALLRAINVGGNNKLPMAALSKLFVDAGCDDVKTYINSGNVVFRATPASLTTLATRIADAIAAEHGFKVPVVLRSHAELAATVAGNPFGADVSRLHVMFLADMPTPERVATLDPDRSPPSEFAVRGRDIYMHIPDGVATTKLTVGYFDKQLATVSTARNWRTVLTLLALSQA